MQIIDQKLGSFGEVHVSVVDGKLVLGVEGDLDLVAQLEKLRGAHQGDLIGGIITVAEEALKKLTAAAK